MKDLKARGDEIALEALKQYVANRAKAAERAEQLDPNSKLARATRELLQKARGEYDDFVASIAATDLAQDGVPAPTAASVEAATVRADISPTEASFPPASPTPPPASQADLTYGQPSRVQAPAPMTNRAEVSPPMTSVVERSPIELAALPAAARTVEPAAPEDSSAEGNVARVLATLRTVFRDRLSLAAEARRDEQAAAPQPPASDPPRDRQHAIGAVASPLEQMPLGEGAAVSNEQTEDSRTTGQHEGFPLAFEEQPPVQAKTSSSPVSGTLRDGRPKFGAIASPPDEEAAAEASADVPAERREVSGTVGERDDATALFVQQELATDLVQDGVPAPTAASVEAAAVAATVRAGSSPTEASVPPASPLVPPARQFDLTYGRASPVQAPPPMTNRAEVPPAKASILERTSIEPAALPAVASTAEPAAPEDSSAEMNVARALATLSSVFREQLSPAPEGRRDKQAATPQREVSETVEGHDDAATLFEQPELAADDAASDAAVSADQAIVSAEQQLHDIDALSERESAAVAKAVLLPESVIIRKPEDTALSTDHFRRQKEEGSSLADPGRQPGATSFDEQPGDRGFTTPRMFDTEEEEPFDAPASEDEYLDSLDQVEDEQPATRHPGVARDQPVSASKELLDDFALLVARQEALTMSEQPKAEEQPTENAAVPTNTGDPALDAFESWLRKWRGGQVT